MGHYDCFRRRRLSPPLHHRRIASRVCLFGYIYFQLPWFQCQVLVSTKNYHNRTGGLFVAVFIFNDSEIAINTFCNKYFLQRTSLVAIYSTINTFCKERRHHDWDVCKGVSGAMATQLHYYPIHLKNSLSSTNPHPHTKRYQWFSSIQYTYIHTYIHTLYKQSIQAQVHPCTYTVWGGRGYFEGTCIVFCTRGQQLHSAAKILQLVGAHRNPFYIVWVKSFQSTEFFLSTLKTNIHPL